MAASQRGVVLVVVLVILLAVTLLGTVVMQGATLQTKMVGNSQARQQAFNAAEATLAVAEQFLATTTTITRESLRLKTNFLSDCSKNGLCFTGAIGSAGSTLQSSCKFNTIPSQEIWEDTTLKVWDTDGKNKPVTVPNMKNPGKYIIEFRCFIDGAGLVAVGEGDALFRITAQGYSDNGDATVMVQSTYRIYLPPG